MAKKLNRREFLKGVAILGATQALAACVTVAEPTEPEEAEAPEEETEAEPAAEEPAEAEEITIHVVHAENRELEPQLHASGHQRVLTTNIYENLVALSPDGTEILPQLATAWERVDDMTYEFTLRKGVTFHSGDPFNAEAVKYTFDRYQKPENEAPQLSQYPFASPEIVDDYTVRISSLEHPDPTFLKRIAGIGCTIVNPRFAEEQGLEGMVKASDGTGPYKCTKWELDGEIVLEAFDDYWGGRPPIDRVVQTAVVEPGTRVAALLAGEADFIFNPPPTEAKAIENSDEAKLAEVIGNRVSFYPFITNKEPTDSKLFRQACNYASNFQVIIDTVLEGRGYRVACMSLPHYFGYNPNLEPYPYDPDKAKELLAEAGYADGVEVEMLQLVGRLPYDKEVGEALAGELTKVGINVNLNFVDIGGAGAALWENPDLKGFHHISWGTGTMDGDYAIGNYWLSDSFFAENSHHYNNPAFDKLIAEARYELDQDKREKMYWEAEQMLYDDAVAIWGYAIQLIYGMSNRLQWEPRRDELVLYKDMTVSR
jgi:peptide/nickel transport system substrate-binding protein